jgi:hypothetical protein
MLHLGLFGIPLYWRTDYSRTVRIWLVVVSILYTVLVAIAVVWGVAQVMKAVRALG